MRAREMHPLCCISMDSPTASDRDRTSEEEEAGGNAVAGVLYKWTNFGRGWRSRWFSLRSGVLSYSKIRVLPYDHDVRLIGDPSVAPRICSRNHSSVVVHLKISSFRESKSDERRFYIFSATKTLHLKTDSSRDRGAWIEALESATKTFPLKSLNSGLHFIQNDISLSTQRLRKRLLEDGLGEVLIKDCEQIMLSEFSQLKLLYEERFNLFAFRQLEDVNVDAAAIQESQLLIKNGFSSSGHGIFSEYSTTESSDDIEKLEPDELSEEDEPSYFDTHESFFDLSKDCNLGIFETIDREACTENDMGGHGMLCAETELLHNKLPRIERRLKLPDPVEKEKGVSLWSLIKDNVGKDLTRVCLPVYFNEPLSSLQKCFEDLEYSSLLDRAYEFGKMGNGLMRILNVAAFAVSGYASSDGRICKPFNPLLGETYEADYPDKGIRFFSEKVSHHPTIIACHGEGRGWKFWGDSNLKSRFWGRCIQLDPVGIITVEFDDGEIFQWSKVTTSIYNLIFGKVYCEHHGLMHIRGNREYSCKLKFKEQSLLDHNPHQVQGFVVDSNGTKVASLVGKWDQSMHYILGEDIPKTKVPNLTQDVSLLWKKNEPAPDPTRYNLSSFAITLNELTSELQEKLPPTDSRRRPDQRHLENGEYEKANAEKQRLEKRQRMSRNMQENGWKPMWFRKDSEDGTFRYVGGYWESRENNRWDGCPDIFGEFSEELGKSSFKQQL